MSVCSRVVARIAVIAAFAVMGVAVVGSVSAEPVVSAVRVGEHADRTRFVVDLSERVDYNLFLLPDPYRVVIDFPELKWRAGETRFKRSGLIRGFRYGLFTPGNFRIVLDVSRPVRVDKPFILPGKGGKPHRLVIDIRPTDRDSFFTAARLAKVPKPAAFAPPPPPLPQKKRNDKRVVVIDAGHGGVDPGTIGVSGLREKAVTLAVGQEVAKQLRATGKYEVVLTRNRDIFIRLRERIRIAREAGGDLFISIHADSIGNRKVRGATVYTLSETSSDKEAAALATKENKSDIIAGINLNAESDEVASILIDLAQRESMNYSARFANILIPELGKRNVVRRNSHRFAGFVVLKAPDVPSVLVELGYLSNRQDGKVLGSRKGRKSLAGAIARAVDRYFTLRET